MRKKEGEGRGLRKKREGDQHERGDIRGGGGVRQATEGLAGEEEVQGSGSEWGCPRTGAGAGAGA